MRRSSIDSAMRPWGVLWKFHWNYMIFRLKRFLLSVSTHVFFSPLRKPFSGNNTSCLTMGLSRNDDQSWYLGLLERCRSLRTLWLQETRQLGSTGPTYWSMYHGISRKKVPFCFVFYHGILYQIEGMFSVVFSNHLQETCHLSVENYYIKCVLPIGSM